MITLYAFFIFFCLILLYQNHETAVSLDLIGGHVGHIDQNRRQDSLYVKRLPD